MKLKLAAYIASEDWRKKYDWVGDFIEGFFEVRLNGKWGFVNTEGVEIVEPKYDSVENFQDGLAVVWLNGKWGYINTKGEEVIPLQCDSSEEARAHEP